MNVTKIGKAEIDLENELFTVELKDASFLINKRLVEKRPDFKKARANYLKTARQHTPTMRKHEKREEYFNLKNEGLEQMRAVLKVAYEEILQDSFEAPVPLRRNRDYEHAGDWRYCLYRGIVYKFDKPGLSTEEMREKVEALLSRQSA